jgi:kinesin family protein 15
MSLQRASSRKILLERQNSERRMPAIERMKVIVRARPLSSSERSCLRVSRNRIELSVPASLKKSNNQQTQQAYTVDFAGDEACTQEEIYESVCNEMLVNFISGYNGCIFAYGQTSSGKTFTMLGRTAPNGELMPVDQGIIPRLVSNLFNEIAKDPSDFTKTTVRVSYLEIYNEVICDLLDSRKQNLNIMNDRVQNLTSQPVASVSEAISFLEIGNRNRHVGETAANERSSRSHAVFVIDLDRVEQRPGQPMVRRTSRLNLVDLAGSERQSDTQATGERLDEAKSINKSLHFLANVIRNLTTDQNVSFRSSVLTHLLRESLVGNSKTTLIANISPAERCYSETINTLNFASSCSNVRLKSTINEEVIGSSRDVQSALEDARRRIAELEANQAPCARCGTQSDEPLVVASDFGLAKSAGAKLARAEEQLNRCKQKIERLKRWQEAYVDAQNLLKMRGAEISALQLGRPYTPSEREAALTTEIEMLRKNPELASANQLIEKLTRNFALITEGMTLDDLLRMEHEEEIRDMEKAHQMFLEEARIMHSYEMNQLNGQSIELQEQLSLAAREKAELKDAVVYLRSQIEALVLEANERTTEVEGLRHVVLKEVDEKQSLAKQLRCTCSELEIARNRVNELEQQSTENHANDQEQRKHSERLTSENEQLRIECERLRAQLQNSESQQRRSATQLGELEQSTASLRSENEELVSRVGTLEQHVEQANSMLRDTRKELAGTSDRLAEQTAAKNAAQAECKQLQLKVNQLESQKSVTQCMAEEATCRLAHVAEELEASQHSAKNLERELKQTKARCDDLEHAVKSKAKQCDSQKLTIDELHAEVREQRKQHEIDQSEAQRMQGELVKLKGELKRSQESFNVLQKEHRTVSESMLLVQNENDRNQVLSECLRQSLDDARSQIETLEDELRVHSDAAKENDSMLSELRETKDRLRRIEEREAGMRELTNEKKKAVSYIRKLDDIERYKAMLRRYAGKFGMINLSPDELAVFPQDAIPPANPATPSTRPKRNTKANENSANSKPTRH